MRYKLHFFGVRERRGCYCCFATTSLVCVPVTRTAQPAGFLITLDHLSVCKVLVCLIVIHHWDGACCRAPWWSGSKTLTLSMKLQLRVSHGVPLIPGHQKRLINISRCCLHRQGHMFTCWTWLKPETFAWAQTRTGNWKRFEGQGSLSVCTPGQKAFCVVFDLEKLHFVLFILCLKVNPGVLSPGLC